MSSSPNDARLVAIRCGDNMFDVALPGDVPLSEMMPALCELGAVPAAQATHVSTPSGPLDSSRTLAELAVADGTLLLLGTTTPAPRRRPATDAAETVAQWATSPQAPHLVAPAVLAAVLVFGAVAAAAALPHAAGAPRLLLVAAAVMAVALLGARWRPDSAQVAMPAAIAAGVLTVALLPATILGAHLTTATVAAGAAAAMVMATAGRIAPLVARAPDDAAALLRAHRHVVSGAAGATAVSALSTVLCATGWSHVVFGVLVASVLLARTYRCAAAPAGGLPRALTACENALLVAVPPAAVWACGGYGAVSGAL
ncbi:EsaB/YukD family protein [Mycolicibacterium confluentis]|nr:EsaB/YukD family protein [Mycolicibacterium confluentis]MCV7320088.1 EsaB/YukD family protein [Mycolicibacterium confluentis]